MSRIQQEFRSLGTITEGTDSTAVAPLFIQSVPRSRVFLEGVGLLQFGGKSDSSTVCIVRLFGILACTTIMSVGSIALCASTSSAHKEAVPPQYNIAVPL